MNGRLLSKLLSLVAMLIGGSMAFSLPWAVIEGGWEHERQGFFGLLGAIAACFVVAAALRHFGRRAQGRLFRKEAMAVVGLSWILATVLGGLPYLLSGTCRAPGVPMSVVDAMFEAQSGFSTTGATVLTELEDPALVPRCILFWRSSTHFLGGLGIIVLFVAILGQGSAGKALMRAEMPGPSHSTPQARMQHTAWILFLIYVALNGSLTVLLLAQGLSLFDALCHAFGTMATGGFSTYNASIGHFTTDPALDGTRIEMTIVLFMLFAGTNFMLLYCVVIGQAGRVLRDVEWRTYVAVILVATACVVTVGLAFFPQDFDEYGTADTPVNGGTATADDPYPVLRAVRFGLFQVVSIMTTTGFCTDEFDQWNSFACGVLLVLMFVGGCAGSTGGGLKVIRHVLFVKILRLEIERAYHPRVVRPLRLGGEVVEDQELRRNVLVYFGLILAIFVFSWLFTITLEPDTTWTEHGHYPEHKLRDAAGCVAATLNNIGPGLGVIGARHSYSNFSPWTKGLFLLLMMLGRLEIFVILVLFVPGFWRSQ